MKKQLVITVLVASLVSVSAYALLNNIWKPSTKTKVEYRDMGYTAKTMYTIDGDGDLVPLDFTQTAHKAMPAIVRVISKIPNGSSQMRGRELRELPDPFKDFFNDDFFPFRFESPNDNQRNRPDSKRSEESYSIGQGSGVIINENGYIVTNNHVIQGAQVVEVVLDNNKKYEAKVIGTDPSTDLGLLRIEEKSLPTLRMVNSDDVQIGEWVLALGNPLSLNKTVTAGIVSAKGRNIDILRSGDNQYAIESFIQTDAAINKGNSGGALVNLNGDLIGINSAIASPTGYYSGYGFAIPSNIVNKVVEDLMKYGEVKRGILGISIINLADPNAADLADSLGVYQGVMVATVLDDGPARKAGVKDGDIIVGIDNQAIASSPQLLEYIGQKRPEDIVKLKVLRNGTEKQISVKLQAKDTPTKKIVSSPQDADFMDALGIELAEPSAEELEAIGHKSGLKVVKLHRGIIYDQTDMEVGYIITKIDGRAIMGLNDLVQALKSKKGGVLLEGYYPDSKRPTYYGLGLD